MKTIDQYWIIGLAKVIYYRFILKVNWVPSFNLVTKIYGANVNGVQIHFKDCPFFDIEFALLDYINNLSPVSSTTFIDAGSFMGTFAIYIAKLSNQNLVVALEPDPDNYKKLLQNIRLNKLANVLPFNLGLWKTDTKLKFDPSGSEISSIPFEAFKKNLLQISTITINSLRKRIARKIDYIKMDIEGAEIEALQGATKCIQKDHPKFVIATYHIRDGSMTKIRVEKILKKYYSKVKSINSKQLITTAQQEA